MKTCILAVFDEDDLKAVPNALEFFRRVGLEQLMVVHNPSLGLKGVVTANYDSRIRELETAVNQAKQRDDFLAAQNYKEELEGAKSDRDLAIREGWTKVPQNERESIYKRIFGNIGTDAVFCLNENMRHDQLFAAMNGFVEVWPKDVLHGEYSIVWPKSIPQQKPVETTLIRVSDTTLKPKTTAPKPHIDDSTPDGRRNALIASRFGGVKSACKKHGIDTTGHSMNSLIEQIIAKEFPAVAA